MANDTYAFKSYCRLCGNEKPRTPAELRFCRNQLPGGGVCGFSLEDRYPVLVLESTAEEILLRFDTFPESGQVSLGDFGDEPSSGSGVNLREYVQGDESIARNHASIRLEGGRYYLKREDREAELLVNGELVKDEREIRCYDRIKIEESLFFFLT